MVTHQSPCNTVIMSGVIRIAHENVLSVIGSLPRILRASVTALELEPPHFLPLVPYRDGQFRCVLAPIETRRQQA